MAVALTAETDYRICQNLLNRGTNGRRRQLGGMTRIQNYRPAVAGHILLFIAGAVWIMVGIMLVGLACFWLITTPHINAHPFELAGAVMALLVHHFGFLKIVDKNTNRIMAMPDKSCLFAFISWKSYLLIAVMITLGAVLRHSAVPRQYLAVIYLGIGAALILSSIRYLRIFIRQTAKHSTRP